MQKFQCLLFVLQRLYICYYIICMNVPLNLKLYGSITEKLEQLWMRKFQCLLSVLQLLFICYYIICMAILLKTKLYGSITEKLEQLWMRKFQHLLFMLKRSYICYYIIFMTVALRIYIWWSGLFEKIVNLQTATSLQNFHENNHAHREKLVLSWIQYKHSLKYQAGCYWRFSYVCRIH